MNKNFGAFGRTIFISHLFFQEIKKRLSYSNNIFFKENMAIKNVASQSLKKKTTGSFSYRLCLIDTILGS